MNIWTELRDLESGHLYCVWLGSCLICLSHSHMNYRYTMHVITGSCGIKHTLIILCVSLIGYTRCLSWKCYINMSVVETDERLGRKIMWKHWLYEIPFLLIKNITETKEECWVVYIECNICIVYTWVILCDYVTVSTT